jgi:hypothetical protein
MPFNVIEVTIAWMSWSIATVEPTGYKTIGFMDLLDRKVMMPQAHLWHDCGTIRVAKLTKMAHRNTSESLKSKRFPLILIGVNHHREVVATY